jgi:hypothetical protein
VDREQGLAKSGSCSEYMVDRTPDRCLSCTQVSHTALASFLSTAKAKALVHTG